MQPHLSLVLGGASSGKSSRAEALVTAYRAPRIYIATAQAFDAEMEAKIADHKISRGGDWTTIEAPHDLVAALASVPANQCVLLDCATMWLSNRLLDGADPESEFPALLDALSGCASPVVVVSNEVGQGIVPESSLGRRFRDLQGRLNQRLAERADLVVGVMAGLPMVLKGRLPGGIEW